MAPLNHTGNPMVLGSGLLISLQVEVLAGHSSTQQKKLQCVAKIHLVVLGIGWYWMAQDTVMVKALPNVKHLASTLPPFMFFSWETADLFSGLLRTHLVIHKEMQDAGDDKLSVASHCRISIIFIQFPTNSITDHQHFTHFMPFTMMEHFSGPSPFFSAWPTSRQSS